MYKYFGSNCVQFVDSSDNQKGTNPFVDTVGECP